MLTTHNRMDSCSAAADANGKKQSGLRSTCFDRVSRFFFVRLDSIDWIVALNFFGLSVSSTYLNRFDCAAATCFFAFTPS